MLASGRMCFQARASAQRIFRHHIGRVEGLRRVTRRGGGGRGDKPASGNILTKGGKGGGRGGEKVLIPFLARILEKFKRHLC